MKNLLVAALVCASAFASACKKEEAKPAAPAAAVEPEIKGRRVDIKASNAGYSPDSVEVKANEEVTLVFTLTEKSSCAEEVAIPSLNILKKLQVGQPVAIPFKATEAG